MREGNEDRRDERLAALADEIDRRAEAGEDVDAEALAREFDVTPGEVRRCEAGVRALTAAFAALPEEAVDLPRPELPPDYEIQGELGRGGMGVVYRARQRSLGRDVAVKVIRPGALGFEEAVTRIRKEARSLARLRHPGIVAVHDVGRAGDAVYYSMDLIEGGSLARRLEAGPLHVGEAIRTIAQVASAVAHSHERGIIHRDLKPANVLLDRDDNAWVADFGLARDEAMSVDASGTGRILGTPAYMSPEQARGEPCGEAADVYAIGALLYECLTGVAPFHGRPLAETIHAVIHEEPVRPRRLRPGIPRDLEAIVLTAMAKRPVRRYPTARAFLEDLRAFVEGRAVRARPPGALRAATRFVARHRSVFGAAALTAAVLAAVGLAVLLPRIGRTPETLLSLARDLESAGEPTAAGALYEEGAARLGFTGPVLAGREERPRDELAFALHAGLLRCRARRARSLLDAGRREEAAAEIDRLLAKARAEFGETGFPGEEMLRFDRVRLLHAEGDVAAARLALSKMRSWFWKRADFFGADETVAKTLVAQAAEGLSAADPAASAAAAWILLETLVRPDEGFAVRDWLLSLGDGVGAALTALVEGTADDLAEETLHPILRLLDVLGLLAAGGHRCPVERTLAALASDEGRPEACRGVALSLLACLADLPRVDPQNRPEVWIRFEPDLAARTLALWRRTEDLAPGESLRERCAAAVSLRATAWLRSHAGFRSRDPADLDAWWAARAGEPPATWLAADLGLPSDATPEAVLASLTDERDGQRRRMHHELLLALAPPEARIPVWIDDRSEPPEGLVPAWRRALQVLADDRPWVLRVAGFRIVDAGEPELSWEEVRPIRVGEAISFEHVEPRLDPWSISLYVPGVGSPPVRARPRRYGWASGFSLDWSPTGLRLRRGAVRKGSRGPGGAGIHGSNYTSAGSSRHAGLVLAADSLEGYSGRARDRVTNRFVLAVATEPGTDAAPWTVDDWRRKVARDLAFLAEGLRTAPPGYRGDFFYRYQQSIWSHPRIAVKLGGTGEMPAILETGADRGIRGDRRRFLLLRLEAGDESALDEPGARETLLAGVSSGLGDAQPFVRLLLATESARIRDLAAEAIRPIDLYSGTAARIERSIDEGKLAAPEWLAEKVDGTRLTSFWRRNRGAVPWLLVGLLAAVLVGFGLRGLRPGAGPAARLRGAPLLVLGGSLLGAVALYRYGFDVLPDAAGWGLAALGILVIRRWAPGRAATVALLGFGAAAVLTLLGAAGVATDAVAGAAGIPLALAFVSIPYLARRLSPERPRPVRVYNVFYTLPVLLLWVAVAWTLLHRGPTVLRMDRDLVYPALALVGIAALSALCSLIGAARRRASTAD